MEKEIKLDNYLDVVKQNILVKEDIQTVHTDVESGDSLVGDLIGRIYQNTIVEQVCDIQPCIGPSGVMFYSFKEDGKRKTDSKTFTLDKIESIGKYNKEWFQDFNASFGKGSTASWVLNNTAWDAKDDLDITFIELLNDLAEVQTEVTFNGEGAPLADEFMNIIGAINKAAALIATETKRGNTPYVICSPKVGAAISTVGLLALDENVSTTNRDYLGRIGKTRFFVDNNATSDYAIVAHHGFGNGNSSIIFSPYVVESKIADDYSVDEIGVLLINRFGMNQHPTDTIGDGNSNFIKKIPVDFGDLTNF